MKNMKGEVRLNKDISATPFKKRRRDNGNKKSSEDATASAVTPRVTMPISKDEKPNWMEIKKRSKVIKENRKKRNHVVQAVKKLFEELKSSNCPQGKRKQLLTSMKSLLKGKLSQVVLSHDMSRVVQCMLRVGATDIHDFIVRELQKTLTDLAKRKYSRHIIKSALKHTNSTLRRRIIHILSEDGLALMSYKISSPIIEEVYVKYANAKEKATIRQCIYGDIYKGLKTTGTKIDEICKQNPDLAPAINTAIKNNLLKLLQKEWCCKSIIVTSVSNEFLNCCQKQDRQEFLDLLKSKVPDLIVTKDGCYLAMQAIWNANTKEKKVIVKSLQEQVIPLAKSDAGSFFILSLFDCVDDTVLMKKAILSKLCQHLEEVLMNNHGRRIIMYLFGHQDAKSFFSSVELEKLKQASTSEYIKKDQTQRLSELREACFVKILKHIQNAPEFWISNGALGLATATILQHQPASLQSSQENQVLEAAFDALAEHVVKTNITKPDGTQQMGIESGSVHHILKKIIFNDSSRHSNSFVSFSECLLKQLSKDVITSWLAVNRGCLTLVFMLETKINTVTEKIKEFLGDKKINKILKQQSTEGAIVLRKKLEET